MRPNDVNQRLAALTVPNVLAGLAVPLAGLVDTAILGHLPTPTALAGVALGSIVFDFLWGLFGFLRMSTTGLVAQARGAGKPREAQQAGLRSVLLGLAIGLMVLLVYPLLGEAAFDLLGGAPDVQQAGYAYFEQRILAAPATLCGFALLGTLLGQGRAKAVLGVALVTNLANIVLDILFVWHWQMGAAGAGQATAISQTLGTAVGLALVLPHTMRTPHVLRNLWQANAVRESLHLNAGIMVRTLLLTSAFALFTQASAAMGTVILAANAILMKVVMTASYFIDGIAFATETMVGEAAGANDTDTCETVLNTASRWGGLTGLAFAGVVVLSPAWTLGLLSDQPEVLVTATSMRGWLIAVMGFGGLAYIRDGFFVGLADGGAMWKAMAISCVLGFLPWLWVSYLTGDPNMLWIGMTLFMAFRVGTMQVLVRRRMRRLNLRPSEA